MGYELEYKQKLVSADEAVKVIKSGDWVDYATAGLFPSLCDAALAKRKDELEDVKVRGIIIWDPIQILEADPEGEHFTYNSFHMIGSERKYCDKGLCYFIPMLYRNLPVYYRKNLEVNVAICGVTPMDKDGYFSFSCYGSHGRAVLDVADYIILEVNETLPRTFGIENKVHISEVNAIVEGPHTPFAGVPDFPASDVDLAIAKQVIERMSDGACVQLGVGAMPDVIGTMIAEESDLKNLGVHSELMVNSHYKMYKAGKLTNLNKSGEFKGKSVYGVGYGNWDMYHWIEDNPTCINTPMDYVNNPRVIAEIDNFVSINNCIGVNIYGEISSESAGHRHISGTGGQLDFVTGAYDCPNGTSFVCFSSTFTDKKGQVHSRITPGFNGDIVTVPRSQTHHLVTEYGTVCLAGNATWERAEKIISIAHPDFRDDLIKSAEEYGIWRRSNKR
ncbi:MAG: butyryl-CoA:acetate CoA-transferase [Clostridiales bacterium]|nr:butyryl-CoA:acetate CoA-transferase [Candidatus Crickella merdequi]